MGNKKDISVLDVTIRDGSYVINYQYTPEQVGRIVRALDRAGVDYIEVSHGCGLGARENYGLPGGGTDEEYVREARKFASNSKIGVLANPAPATRPENIDAVLEQIDFIRFVVTGSDFKAAESNISYALKKRPNLRIFTQLTRSSRRTENEMIEAGRVAEAMGVNILYIVDTAGSLMPEQVQQIVGNLASRLKIEIGFHGHNNLGLAIANTLAAVRAGARSMDASLRGMGRAGGNAQLEALTSLLKRMGLGHRLDLDMLLAAGEELVTPIMPPMRGIAAEDVLTADANIDLYPIAFYYKLAEAAAVPFNKLVRALGSDEKLIEPDIEAITRALAKLGKDAQQVLTALGVKKS